MVLEYGNLKNIYFLNLDIVYYLFFILPFFCYIKFCFNKKTTFLFIDKN